MSHRHAPTSSSLLQRHDEHNNWSAAHTSEQIVQNSLTRSPSRLKLSGVKLREQAKCPATQAIWNQPSRIKRDSSNRMTNNSLVPPTSVTQQTKRLSSSSANYVVSKLGPTVNLSYTGAAEKVARWLDALPETFARVPENSKSKSELALEWEKEKIIQEGDNLTKTSFAQLQPQQQLCHAKKTLVASKDVKETSRQVELQRQHDRMAAGIVKVRTLELTRNVDVELYAPAAERPARSVTEPFRRENLEINDVYLVRSNTLPANGLPPIPSRSPIRPHAETFREASPGNVQHAKLYSANSSQPSPVAILQKAATVNSAANLARDFELRQRKDNPALVIELRAGMERRRQRERARNEDIEQERLLEDKKILGWATGLWK